MENETPVPTEKPIEFVNIRIKCLNCQNYFDFTPGEQRAYQLKGLYPPKRCPTCRLIRKQQDEQKKEQQN